MRARTGCVVAVFGLLAVGCGSGEPENSEDRETVFDPLVDTLEQAEAVEDVAAEQKVRLDRALREAEGEEDDPEGM